MISRIKFSNFILINEIELEFHSGMNVITGETGAGKSVLMGGLNLTLGKTARGNLAYDKNKKIYLEVDFIIDEDNEEIRYLLEKHDIELEDKELFFVKEIKTNGKATSFINGRRVTNTVVKEFRNQLIDIHSQHDQMNLYDCDYQLKLLDAYGQLMPLRAEISHQYATLKKSEELLKEWQKKSAKERERFELYQYQLEELNALELTNDEEELLDQEYNRLSNTEEILELSHQINSEFNELDDNIIDKLNFFINKLSEFDESVPQFKESVDYLMDAVALIQDGVDSAIKVDDIVELDPERLVVVEQRIQILEEMKRKFHVDSVNALIKYRDKLMNFLETSINFNDDIEKKEQEINKLKEKITKLGKSLSSKRQKVAKRFEKSISQDVSKLSLPNAKLLFKFAKNKCLNESGIDKVELNFSANLGIELQPLKDSASGGELSRMLLVFKKILSDMFPKRSMIFDEIDVGIGGNTALHIADYIAAIGKRHQILVITHLPQIAVVGDKHFKIDKEIVKQKTEIVISVLNDELREKEIARMLSGEANQTSLAHAREILKKQEKR